MTDRILLPAGMLPPGEWAVGARVRLRGGSYVLTRRLDSGGLWLSAPGEEGACSAMDAQVAVRIDITTGPLDHATRALWHALELGEQPLTAPGWGVHNGSGCWALSRRSMLVHSSRVGYHAEPDPRRALRLACEAVWAERGRGGQGKYTTTET